MKTFKEIQDFFSRYKLILLEEYNWLSELGIFGSYVRGEQNKESDVDVLVDYTKVPDLIDLIDFENYLSDNLGMKVDSEVVYV
jgi:hypothetical protein